MSATNDKKNDKLSYGLILLAFGCIFLLDKIGVLSQIPIKYNFISISSFFLIAGIIFMCTQPKRALSWVFLGIGVFLNFDIFFGWMSQYSKLIVPIAFIVAGIALLFSYRK